MPLNSAEISVRFKADQSGANDLGPPRFMAALEKIVQFTNGVLASQANLLFADTRQIAASGTDDIDLAGVLTDAFGAVITAAEIVGVVIVAKATNVNDLVVGNHATAAWFGMFGAAAHTTKVRPGGVLCNFAPDASGLGAVTAATADMLRIVNGGAGSVVDYDIVILARNA